MVPWLLIKTSKMADDGERKEVSSRTHTARPKRKANKRPRKQNSIYIGGSEENELAKRFINVRDWLNFETTSKFVQWLLDEAESSGDDKLSSIASKNLNSNKLIVASAESAKSFVILPTGTKKYSSSSTNKVTSPSSSSSSSTTIINAATTRTVPKNFLQTQQQKSAPTVTILERNSSSYFRVVKSNEEKAQFLEKLRGTQQKVGFNDASNTKKADSSNSRSYMDVLEADSLLLEEEELGIQDYINENDGDVANSTNVSHAYTRCEYGSLENEYKILDDPKCIASKFQLMKLIGTKCRQPGCTSNITQINSIYIGLTMKLEWHCELNHKNCWYSSPFYCSTFTNDYIVDSALLLSGGQVNQFHKFCKFANLGEPTSSTFFLNQHLYISPAVQQEYEDLENEMISMLPEEDIVLYGDCQLNSTGSSATKAAYTIMDYNSKKLVMMACDDRQMETQSTDLETNLFMKCMNYLIGEQCAPISEICTKSHGGIEELIEGNPLFEGIEHSFDVLHEAEMISEKLTHVVTEKKKLKTTLDPWVPSIRKNFWYACSNCDGDEAKLRKIWLNLFKHICDDHSCCFHGPITKEKQDNPWLKEDSEAMDMIRKHCMRSNWLKSLSHFTRNRHAGSLEAYHNLTLLYCPKRIGDKNDAFKTRHQLTFIDYNTHLNRKQLRRKDGSLVWVRKYGRRVKDWFLCPVPEPKQYPYIKNMMAKILWRRRLDLKRSTTATVEIPAKKIVVDTDRVGVPSTSSEAMKTRQARITTT